MNHSKLPFAEVLCCPACKKGELALIKDNQCACEACGQTYPIREGVPILIVPGRSVLDPLQLAESEFSLFETAPGSLIDRLIAKTTRPISRNLAAASNYNRLAADLSHSGSESRVLIVGGSVMGAGADKLFNMSRATFIETDVCWGPRTQLICDAHDAPFKSETMDAVVAQAVLEHVVDPALCVAEIYRVLKPNGLVYAETPFLQHVHMGPYDFTRFTHLGHRRLFRDFEELSSGISGGPGMALAWALRGFFHSLAKSPRGRLLAAAVASWVGAWLKYLDSRLVKNAAAFDSASGFYFYGRKSQRPLADDDLVRKYQGGQLGFGK